MQRVILRVAAVVSWLAISAAGPAWAQLPGESVYTPNGSSHQEFLARTYEEVRSTLSEWQDLLTKRDLKGLKKIIADEVTWSPLDGWSAKGKGPVADSLTSRMPRMSGYWLTPQDFDASADMAYVMGTFRYDLADSAGIARPAAGAFVVVLAYRGRWRIRSYLERADRPSGVAHRSPRPAASCP